jgi:hypothetical protein
LDIGLDKERLLAKLPKSHAIRYRSLYNRWLTAYTGLRQTEIQELRNVGLIQDQSATKGASGHELRFCNLTQFSKMMGVSRHDIQNALNLESMPGRQQNGSLEIAIAKPWWLTHKVGKRNGVLEQAAIAKAQQQIDQARITKAEADRQEREVSEKWVCVESVKILLESIGLKTCQDIDALLEDRQGLRLTVMTVLSDVCPTLTDATIATIEQQLAKRFRQANDGLKERFKARAGQPVK